MLYIKPKLNNQIEIKVDLYEDEISTSCAGCGQEIQVTEKDLINILQSDDMDFQGTSWLCQTCVQTKHQIPE